MTLGIIIIIVAMVIGILATVFDIWFNFPLTLYEKVINVYYILNIVGYVVLIIGLLIKIFK